VVSVIVPAHQEAAVIGRCLSALAGDGGAGLDVVVVANGCTDGTAAVARAALPSARVFELAEASKVAALERGDAAARGDVRVYVDADVEVGAAALHAVAAALRAGTGVLCAAPRIAVAWRDAPWFVRAFYRTFLALPYAGDDLVGNGVYALSAEGRRRFGSFPDITADDLFVRNLFTGEERATVAGAEFVVHPPRTLRGLLAMRQRAYRGNREYRERFTSRADGTRDLPRLARLAARRPVDVTVYLAVNVAARVQLRLRRTAVRWERDDSARVLSPAGR
jgi:glycosyltransferase involved in cell wall biosynthesis